jgi:hypothetical protein
VPCDDDDDAVLLPRTRLPCGDDACACSSEPCDDDGPSELPLHDRLSCPSTPRSPCDDDGDEGLLPEPHDDADEFASLPP